FRYVSDSNNRYIPDISHSDPFDYRPPPSPPDGRIIPPLPDGRIIPPPPDGRIMPPPPDRHIIPPPPESSDYDFNIELDPMKPSQQIRKIKTKMIQNKYGDPLNIKLKI
ncbi:MAG: hypothetical protein Q8910_02435, partial [Bacteroidota bacterium]|nr:hypothetical protein [Bacteroidota bacterium]